MGIAAGVAAIGAVATIGGSVLSANAQKKAGRQAADAQTQSSNQQIAFAKDTYNQNAMRLDPYNQSGQFAQGVLNGLLYGNSSPSNPANQPSPVDQAAAHSQWAQGALDNLRGVVRPEIFARVNSIQDPSERLAALEPMLETNDRAAYQSFQSSNPRPTATSGALSGGVTSTMANNAWDQFRNSSNYQFRFNEGMRGVQQGMGALGQFDSGASRKAMNDYSANVASDALGQYMGMLQQQQQTGLSAAGALAGVGVSTMGAVNGALQSSGDARANAALASGRAQSGMYSGIASGIGSLTSSLASSFARPSTLNVGTGYTPNSAASGFSTVGALYGHA